MASINVELGYFDHPKTRRLIARLGKGADILPIRLWEYTGRFHAKDGRLTRLTATEIESLVGWWGKEEAMIEAMLDGPWIHRDDDGTFYVHEWIEHQGHIQAYKEKATKAAMARWQKMAGHAPSNAASNAPSITPSNAPSMPQAMLLHGSAAQSPPIPPQGGGAGKGVFALAGEFGVPVAQVLQLLETLAKDKSVRSPMAVARDRLREQRELPQRPDLDCVLQWCKAGSVESIDGTAIVLPVKRNSLGLYLNGADGLTPTIAVSRIRFDSIRLRADLSNPLEAPAHG